MDEKMEIPLPDAFRIFNRPSKIQGQLRLNPVSAPEEPLHHIVFCWQYKSAKARVEEKKTENYPHFVDKGWGVFKCG